MNAKRLFPKMRGVGRAFLFILVALLSSACGSLFQTGIDRDSQLSNPPATAAIRLPPTWTPTPTLEPDPTEMDEPTVQTTPQPTPVPSEIITQSVIDSEHPGWQRVETEKAQFWLPDTYQVINLGTEFGVLFEALFQGFMEGFVEAFEELGEELGATPQPTEEIPEIEIPGFDFLIAMNEQALTFIMMVSEPIEGTTDLDTQLDIALAGIETDYVLTVRQVIDGSKYPMARAFVELNGEGQTEGTGLIYVILTEENSWTFNFTAPRETFQGYLLEFEEIIYSFELTD